jgi:hypothetical protein
MADEVTCPACDERIAARPADRKKGLLCPACGARVISAAPPSAAKRRRDEDDDEDEEDAKPAPAANPFQGPIAKAIAGVLGIAILVAVVWGAIAGVRWATRAVDRATGEYPAMAEDPAVKRGEAEYLTRAISPFEVQQGPWALGIGQLGDPANGKILLRGEHSTHGLSMHPPDGRPCRASFNLDGRYRGFRGSVALNDFKSESGSPVRFTILCDGNRVWASGPVTRGSGPESFAVNLSGVRVLTLETELAGGRHIHAHAVWIEPVLEK